MNNRTHIQNELQGIAPGLINIPVTIPYTLPPAYFSGLAEEVVLSIKKETVLPELLAGFSKAIPYSVPAGYFEQFSDSLLQELHNGLLTNEVMALPGKISRIMPYAVPAGYFENFPKLILQKIKETKQQTIPAGYFENLPDVLLSKVRRLDTSKELEDVAPFLNSISKQPVQYVPAGYFDNLKPDISGVKKQIPVVSLVKANTWFKYVVAASIVLLLSFGAYFLFNNNTTAVPSIANQPTESVINDQLAKLDATTIEDYLKTNNAVVQTALPSGGVEELRDGDLDELLQGFTNQQLKKHIEDTPELPTVTNLKNHI